MEAGVRWRLGRGRVGRQMGLANFPDQTLAAGQKAIPWSVIAQVLAPLCGLSSSLKAGAITAKHPQRFSFARIPA